MEKTRLGLWAPILVIAAALLMLAVSTGTVDAARGGARGGGKPGGSTTTATVSVSPNPATSPAYVTISGSGFKANTSVMVGVGGYISYYGVTTDSSGSFVLPYPRAVWGPCTCVAEAWGQNNKYEPILLASTPFTVLP